MPPGALAARVATRVSPGTFERTAHAYAHVAPARMHSGALALFSQPPEALARDYAARHAGVDPQALLELIAHDPKHLAWAGGDLLPAVGPRGDRAMVLLEVNSCPSGLKAMPAVPSSAAPHLAGPLGAYGEVVRAWCTRAANLAHGSPPDGVRAVLFDKNWPEVTGYAAALATHSCEEVWLVPWTEAAPDTVQAKDGELWIRDAGGTARRVGSAIRYVTGRPWTRLPVDTHTPLQNPISACLLGGRNKLIAAKAYAALNEALHGTGLRIPTPVTHAEVCAEDVPRAVAELGGRAVIKNPYSNAGQGVAVVETTADVDTWRTQPQRYGRFVVQGLIAGAEDPAPGPYAQRGIQPHGQDGRFAADVRVVVVRSGAGFTPVAAYARHARAPLQSAASPWERYGTNLSVRAGDGGWDAESHRLVTLSEADFPALELSAADLVDAYVITVLAAVAIDRFAETLLGPAGEISEAAFRAACPDDALFKEIRWTSGGAD